MSHVKKDTGETDTENRNERRLVEKQASQTSRCVSADGGFLPPRGRDDFSF